VCDVVECVQAFGGEAGCCVAVDVTWEGGYGLDWDRGEMGDGRQGKLDWDRGEMVRDGEMEERGNGWMKGKGKSDVR
jgi:hypothetical protein